MHYFLETETDTYNVLITLLQKKKISLIIVHISSDHHFIMFKGIHSETVELLAPSRHLDLFYTLQLYIQKHHLPTQIQFLDAPPGGNTPPAITFSKTGLKKTSITSLAFLEDSGDGFRHYHLPAEIQIYTQQNYPPENSFSREAGR